MIDLLYRMIRFIISLYALFVYNNISKHYAIVKGGLSLKKIAKYLYEYKKDVIFTVVLVIIETMLELWITVTIGSFIDVLANKNAGIEVLYHYGFKLLILTLVLLIAGVWGGWVSIKASAGLAKNLRNGMFDKIQDFSFFNIEKFSTASLITRMTTDIMNVQNSMIMILRVATKSPITLICGLIMAFYTNWKIGLVFVVIVPLLFFGIMVIAKLTLPIFKKIFKIYDKLNNVTRENLSGIRVVKSFVREHHETDKFMTVSNDLKSKFTKAECILALNAPMMQIAIYLCMVITTWFAAKAIVESKNGTVIASMMMTTGELQNFLTYSLMILMSLMMVSMIYVMLMMSKESAARILAVLNENMDISNTQNPLTVVENGQIEFENVSFSYSKNVNDLSLKDISLTIKSGEVIGIIGGTGSGKSSLIQLISRLYDVTSGCIKVSGHDVRKYDIQKLRNQVAVVLQKNVLFSGTLKENLRWGNENATDEEIIRVCKLAQADSFIREMPDGYDTYIERGGTNVSGGQKQRICIARALLKKPKILILDDSTSAVDTKTDSMIRKALRDQIPHTTKIIIAQRISSVEDADRIIVMDHGTINAIGTHEELLESNRIYREVAQSQQKGLIE